MKKIVKLLLSLVMIVIIVGQGALPAKADESPWVQFCNNSYISNTVINVGESIDLISASSGGYSKTGIYAGRLSDDVVKVKYVWTILDLDTSKRCTYASYTIGIGSSKTVTTEKFNKKGYYSISCQAEGITESGDTFTQSKNFTLNVGERSWVEFQNKSSVSKTIAKVGESITLTSRGTGGYSPTGYYMQYGKVVEDVVKVEYVWQVETYAVGNVQYYGPYTISKESSKSISINSLPEGVHLIRCTATPITKSGERHLPVVKEFEVTVGGRSWVEFKNTSSVSKTFAKVSDSITLKSSATGGYSPTGFYMQYGKVIEDVAQVEYEWKVETIATGSVKKYGPYTVSKSSSKSISIGTLPKGGHIITCTATPVTKNVYLKLPVKKKFKIVVGENDWMQFKNSSFLSKTTAKVGETVSLYATTSGGYSRTGQCANVQSDDIEKVKYVWYVTDYNRKKYNVYYKSTGYISRGTTSVIGSEKLQEGKYKFTCYAYAVTKSGVSLPVETKDIMINVTRK